jgi:outer membrane lipoprotein SlyB
MELTLVSFQMNGQTYLVETRPDTRVSGSHKKRNWWLMGGGAAGGAGIGALAGGGTGALIGAGAGAVAGTTTAFFTGKKNVKLPVETPLVFSLRSSIAVQQA